MWMFLCTLSYAGKCTCGIARSLCICIVSCMYWLRLVGFSRVSTVLVLERTRKTGNLNSKHSCVTMKLYKNVNIAVSLHSMPYPTTTDAYYGPHSSVSGAEAVDQSSTAGSDWERFVGQSSAWSESARAVASAWDAYTPTTTGAHTSTTSTSLPQV